MKKLTISIFSLLLLAGAADLFARGADESSDASAETRPLTILYPQSVSSIPMLMVIEGYPNDYSGEFFTDHPQALAQLLQGEIDLLSTGYSVGLNRFNAAGDIRLLATPVWSVSALMTAEPIDSLADLAGGTVYSPFEGSPIDIYLNGIFSEAGLTGQVEIAYAPFPQSAGLLAQKKIDAAVLVEPLASKLEIAGAAYRFENLYEGWARVTGGEPRSPQVSVFARASTVDENAASLALFQERYAKAVEAVAADPAGAAAHFAEELGFPVPVVQKALENTLFEMPADAEVKAILESYSRAIGIESPAGSFYAGL